MSRQRLAIQVLAVLVVLGSGAVLVWRAVSTSSARVTATTEGTSTFSAGVVDLTQPDTVVDLLLDADDLYPGIEISGCVEIEYSGSIPATVRLHAADRQGSGLEDYIDLTLVKIAGDACPEADDEPTGTPLFSGRLAALWQTHPDYAAGIPLAADMTEGERVVIHATATVVDDNRAQGLTTDFAVTIEARP